MYKYLISYGSYEDYREMSFSCDKKYSEDELFEIVKKCVQTVKDREGDVYGSSLSDELSNVYAMKPVEYESRVFCGAWDIEDILDKKSSTSLNYLKLEKRM